MNSRAPSRPAGPAAPGSSGAAGYVVERHDQENGSITYEVWDYGPATYRRLCSINELNDSLQYHDNDRRPRHCAKSDAELICRALNTMHVR